MYNVSVGERFYELTVVRIMEKRILFECSCGDVITFYKTEFFNSQRPYKSCGCKKYVAQKMSNTRPYRIWTQMKARCDRKNHMYFYLYGGRGISYPDKWKKFSGFWEDMKEDYFEGGTLNRIDNEKGYSKENCKWSSRKEQTRNRRNNVTCFFQGRVVCLSELVEITKIPRSWFYTRMVRTKTKRTLQEVVDNMLQTYVPVS